MLLTPLCAVVPTPSRGVIHEGHRLRAVPDREIHLYPKLSPPQLHSSGQERDLDSRPEDAAQERLPTRCWSRQSFRKDSFPEFCGFNVAVSSKVEGLSGSDMEKVLLGARSWLVL